MKKLFIAIVAIATLTSCEGLLNVIANEPIFTAASSEVLDGQAFVLHRSGTCDYFWEGGSASVEFSVTPNPTINGEGKEAVAYVEIKDKSKQVDAEFTIHSVNNDDVEHKSDEDIIVKNWKIGIFDADGQEIAGTFSPATGSNYVTLAKNKVYTARPVFVSNGKVVERVPIRGITKKDKPGDGKLAWDKVGGIEIKEAGDLEFTFQTSTTANTATIKAHVDNTVLNSDKKLVKTTVLTIQ